MVSAKDLEISRLNSCIEAEQSKHHQVVDMYHGLGQAFNALKEEQRCWKVTEDQLCLKVKDLDISCGIYADKVKGLEDHIAHWERELHIANETIGLM